MAIGNKIQLTTNAFALLIVKLSTKLLIAKGQILFNPWLSPL